MATVTEFPDRELLGEDVIWCEASEGKAGGGFLSSHCILSTATHAGGVFGPVSGWKVTFRTIADTYCRKNRVWDEWLIRDNAAIALQLGSTAQEAAQHMINAGDHSAPLTPCTDEAGPYAGRGNVSAWADTLAGMLQRITAAGFATITNTYDRACHLSSPGGAEGYVWASVETFWIRLRSAFPEAECSILHQIGRGIL